MWRGNPVLTAVIFGLPFGFLSLIFYSICCADILDANDDDDDDCDEGNVYIIFNIPFFILNIRKDIKGGCKLNIMSFKKKKS